jgi:type II secretory ATPase GspE/PulE/Tfp pilus assembly ATPase PilB-like protein
MTIKQKDLSTQLLRLFHDAGMIDRATLSKYVEKNAGDKTIVDVMTQEVSLDTFRDLLTAGISFKRTDRRLEREVFKGLSATGMVNDEELLHLLAAHQPPAERLLEALRRDGAIDEATAQRVAAEQDDSAAGAYESLLRGRTLTADGVGQWLSRSDNRQLRRAALYTTIRILEFNGLLGEAEARRQIGELDGGGIEEVGKKLGRKLDLSLAGMKTVLERNWNVPSVDLATATIDPKAVKMFPPGLIRRQMILPLECGKEGPRLAMADPFNVTLVALLEWATGQWPRTAFAPAAQIIEHFNAALDRAAGVPQRGAEDGRDVARPATTVESSARPARPTTPAGKSDGAAEPRPARLEASRLVDNQSAVQLVSSMIESAIELRTTDIHIEPTREGLAVRFRIDGSLNRIMTVPPAIGQPVVSRVKVLADMDVTERRRPQDGHFELNLGDHAFDFRISTLPSVLGEKLVIRILDSSRVMTGVENLGMLKPQREDFEWMLSRPHGMILVTGPTGSGKTSTLYSGLHKLNIESRNLVTIEDPVEYQLAGINQVQVDANIDMGFAEGLRSILRQDPDVIMVGEIRDATTAQIAIRAAMTGHLVLSTLHTNTALGAIDTLVNLGAKQFMVAGSLAGILTQRLLRMLCEKCKKPMKLTDEIRAELNLESGARKRIFQAAGCDHCLGSGYLGRSGAFEVIKVTDNLRPLIAEHQSKDLRKAVREAGVMSLRDAAAAKVLEGTTSVDEVRKKIMMEI